MTNFFYFVGVSTTIICILLVLALFFVLIIKTIRQLKARAKKDNLNSNEVAMKMNHFEAQAIELQKIIDFLEKKEQAVRTP